MTTTRKSPKKGWAPELSPVQRSIFNDSSPFVLVEGAKASDVLAHCDVRHCYENEDALVLLLSPMRAAERLWRDLTLALPHWVYGIGLEHSDSKIDPNTKDRHIWIGNVYGGWSKILLMCASSSQVQYRIKGLAPSRIHILDLTRFGGRQCFDFLAAQIGKRRNIRGPQQYTASGSPKPGNWVYKLFYEECIEPTGKRDPNYSLYRLPEL